MIPCPMAVMAWLRRRCPAKGCVMLWVLLLALDAGPPGDAAGRDGAVVRDANLEAADYGLQVAVEAEAPNPVTESGPDPTLRQRA